MQGLVGNGDQLFNGGGNRAPEGENRVEASKTYLIWTGKWLDMQSMLKILQLY
jgi:hypothetical protein